MITYLNKVLLNYLIILYIKFPLMQMGVLSSVSSHVTLPLNPHRHEEKNSAARVCIVSFKTSPPSHKKVYAKVQNHKPITPPCPPKKCKVRGVVGVPDFF